MKPSRGSTPLTTGGRFSWMLASLLVAFAATLSQAASPAAPEFDLLLVGGRVVDGSGNPWFQADVAIRGDRIVAIGQLRGRSARRVIEVGGRVVAPGFIDLLGHSERYLLVDASAESKIRQGITTEVTGEGESIAPQNARTLAEEATFEKRFGVKVDWRTLEDYFRRLERHGTAMNLGTFVGATQVRRYVLGDEKRVPTPDELAEMEKLVAQAMEDGALGVSSSLVYAPASFASTEELIALARVAARYGGLYATHMRGEGDTIFSALEETFRIAREARIPAEIWHLKVAGKNNWGKMKEVIARIEQARASGLDITADQYPYVAGATSLSASIPPWAHEGGRTKLLERLREPALRARLKKEISQRGKDWENFYFMAGGAAGIQIASVENPALKPFEGKRLAEFARARRLDPLDALFDFLLEDQALTGAIYFLMSEEDVALAMQQPWVGVDCDYGAVRATGPLSTWKPHPRVYGTFPRILGRYVREQKKLRLEEAIRKMTSLAAQRVGFTDRGLLRPGFFADVAVFNPDTIMDRATFENPAQYSEGMDYVIVNGQLVLDAGRLTEARPGRVLRGPGWTGTGGASRAVSVPFGQARGRIVDLSYAISETLPAWPGDTKPFEARINARAEQAGYFSRSFSMLEHFGTHLDAPIHFPPGKTAVDAIPPERLFGPAVVLEVRARVAQDADYRIQPADVQDWERRRGRIPAGAIVLARTGWAARWPDEQRYRNQDAAGVIHFPGFSLEAVQLLLARGVSGLGIDTLSVDYGPSKDFPVHKLSHGADLYHLENLADLSALPEAGAFLVVAPIKLAGGSGGPARVFALLPD